MYLDLRDKGFARPLYEHGVHEPRETDFLAKALQPGMTFIDIGAHVGYYTLLGAAAVGKEGKVIAFEPEPYNLEILTKNVALNELTNVVVEGKGISTVRDRRKYSCRKKIMVITGHIEGEELLKTPGPACR